MEDLVSTLRSLEHRDAFVWVESVFVVHIIMNAWIAYSSTVIRIKLEPHPWDALNVFALSAAHFAINTFVGSEATEFLIAVGVYSLIAAATVYSATIRGRHDPGFDFPSDGFRSVIILNLAAGFAFLLFALLTWLDVVAGTMSFVLVASTIPYASVWLLVFWRCWSAWQPTSAGGASSQL